MNLTGKWKGEYTYGKGYPKSLVGMTEPFEFNLVDANGVISGSCVDKLVIEINGNESYILGTFTDNKISFKKRYKFHSAIDENGNYVMPPNQTSDGVDYVGKLRKKVFSREIYFSGEWTITVHFKDQNNLDQICIFNGTWKMNRVV